MNVIHIFIEMAQLAFRKTVVLRLLPLRLNQWDYFCLQSNSSSEKFPPFEILYPLDSLLSLSPPSLHLTWQVRAKGDSAAEFSGVRAGFQSLRYTQQMISLTETGTFNRRQNHWDQLFCWNESTRIKDTGPSEETMCVLQLIIYFRRN